MVTYILKNALKKGETRDSKPDINVAENLFWDLLWVPSPQMSGNATDKRRRKTVKFREGGGYHKKIVS